MNKPTLVVLAAGIGSRYGGLKQLDTFTPQGDTILDFSIYDAIQAGFGKVVFIIRKRIEEDFKAFFNHKLEGKIEVEYVFQEIENIPGVISYLTSLFSENGVNIEEFFSCWRDTVFVIAVNDLGKVLEFLHFS